MRGFLYPYLEYSVFRSSPGYIYRYHYHSVHAADISSHTVRGHTGHPTIPPHTHTAGYDTIRVDTPGDTSLSNINQNIIDKSVNHQPTHYRDIGQSSTKTL